MSAVVGPELADVVEERVSDHEEGSLTAQLDEVVEEHFDAEQNEALAGQLGLSVYARA